MSEDEKWSGKFKLAGYEIASTGQLLVRAAAGFCGFGGVTCHSKKEQFSCEGSETERKRKRISGVINGFLSFMFFPLSLLNYDWSVYENNIAKSFFAQKGPL